MFGIVIRVTYQYWQLANFDKCVHTDLGKLGGAFFDGSTKYLGNCLQRRPEIELADLSAMGVSPEGSGPYVYRSLPSLVWFLTLPALLSRLTRSKKHKLCEEADTPPSKRSRLLRLHRNPHLELSSSWRSKPDPTVASPFTSLPNEIIMMIYSHIPDCMPTVFLALTCRRHWQIGRPFIQSRVQEASSWAGDRIICLGDYCVPCDTPSSLELTKAEETSLLVLDEIEFEDEDDDTDDGITPHISLYEYAEEQFKNESEFDLRYELRQTLLRGSWIDETDYSLFNILADDPAYWTPESSLDQLILRNLTTGEYVDGKAFQRTKCLWLEQNPDSNLAEYFLDYDFGQIVVMRTSWSAQGSTAMRYTGDLHRGVWAGHRFNIVTAKEMQKDKKKREWKDVSKEILSEIVAIWDAEG